MILCLFVQWFWWGNGPMFIFYTSTHFGFRADSRVVREGTEELLDIGTLLILLLLVPLTNSYYYVGSLYSRELLSNHFVYNDLNCTIIGRCEECKGDEKVESTTSYALCSIAPFLHLLDLCISTLTLYIG